MNPKPANFWERYDSTEDKQGRVVTNGGASEKLSPIMPSFGDSLSPQQIRDVLAYVRDWALLGEGAEDAVGAGVSP